MTAESYFIPVPAAEAIEYETRVFQYNQSFITTKTGTPTKHTDDSWDELQQPGDGLIQASRQVGIDVDNLVKTIQSKKDPSQHMYGLEVYHQLHVRITGS